MTGRRSIEELRGRIDAIDAAIVAAVNERLALVEELWQVKAELGDDRVDAERERQLRQALAAGNPGPLSQQGLDELVDAVLGLVKRELGTRRG